MNPAAVFIISMTLLFSSTAATASDQVKSIYTKITKADCIQRIDDRETGAYTLNCAGIGGFRLLALRDDERSSINIITPSKRQFKLDYWDLISPGFTSLDAKAEWRVVERSGKQTPIGLIIRIILLDQSDLEHPRKISYLAVARIANDMSCVTSVIRADSRESIARARKDADTKNSLCL